MARSFFVKSYKALNDGSRRERKMAKPLIVSTGMSSDTYGSSDPEDSDDTSTAQDGYESEEGSTASWGSYKSVGSISSKIGKRLRFIVERKARNEDDDSRKSSRTSLFPPRNSIRFPNPFPTSPSSVWTVNHASHRGFGSSESSQDDGSFPTMYPVSLPMEGAGVPYSLRSAIGDGSTRQPDSSSVMERRTLRPNGSHLNTSFWSDSGSRDYMEDRFTIDEMGAMSVDCPVILKKPHASLSSSPRGIVDFSPERICTAEKTAHDASSNSAKVPATMFAVFDGHGGPKASQYCCDWMSSYVRNEKSFPSLESALRSAYHRIDEDFVGTGEKDGSTACTCIVVGSERIVCANAGDSRAIVVRRDGSVARLSRDHKPSVPDETRRITDLGGRITYVGRWRIEGSLAVSRGIGDTALKPYVTAEPEVCEMDIGVDDLFLVIASDGVFDKLDNERVAQMILSDTCSKGSRRIVTHPDKLRRTAKKLCDKAKKSGSGDNLCAIVVGLHSSD